MTNDEAIYTLKNTAWLGSEEQAEKVSEAVRMAVEALKTQLPKEDTTSDCISRHAAIDALMAILDKPKHAEFLYTDEICKVLNELPSVQSGIIHCKDCRWQKDQSGSTAWLPCRVLVTPDDFYCGRAERRTE